MFREACKRSVAGLEDTIGYQAKFVFIYQVRGLFQLYLDQQQLGLTYLSW